MSEFGNVLLLIACLLSLTYLFLPVKFYRFIAVNIFFCVLTAMIMLIYYHITDNFLFENVYYYSHTTKPLIYKICGAWGNKEGSILLWTLVLTFYLFLMNICIRENDKIIKISVVTQGLICFCFLLFVLFESNPFAKVEIVKTNGLGFNPILQDIALAIHPPILYLGYLGFSVPFSLSIASLILGIEGSDWARIVKSWVFISWSLLTLGISLGSWWAYRELGWGGFWFWDPIENVSLMLWLITVILAHLLIIIRNYNVLRDLGIFFTLMTFILSIAGTFLVRSGILDSVHAFAHDLIHGLHILILLGTITIISLVVFIVSTILLPLPRYSMFQYSNIKETDNQLIKTNKKIFFSKFIFIFINNALFIIAFFIIFVGTIYPIILKYFTGEDIVVSTNYYNSLFNPVMLMALMFMLIGHRYSSWGRSEILAILYEYRLSFCSIGAILPFIFHMQLMIVLSISVSTALLVFILEEYSKKVLLFKIKFSKSILMAKKISKSYYAMIIAHAGVAILIFGIACLIGWQETKESYLKIGDYITINRFKVILKNVELIKKENFHAVRGTLDVVSLLNNNVVGKVTPEYRFYIVEGQKNIEIGIHHNLFSDIYVVIGEINRDKSKIAIKVYYKPGISAIWFGSFLIAFGSFFSVIPSFSLKNFGRKVFCIKKNYLIK